LLPALRHRKEDLGLLLRALLLRCAGNRAKDIQFQAKAVRALMLYEWPRNVRELELALSAAIALSGDGRIRHEHLPGLVRRGSESAPSAFDGADADVNTHARLIEALKKHGGNVSAVARELGKARVQIRRWCKRFDVDPAAFGSTERSEPSAAAWAP
jgi:transcriptional regulator of acetoin/glycerol metabolism